MELYSCNLGSRNRVFHKIGFSAFQGSETDEIQNASPIFDVESESEEKMGTFFSGKKISLDMAFEICKFRDFSSFFQIAVGDEPTHHFNFHFIL